jgi:hypothetical protein
VNPSADRQVLTALPGPVDARPGSVRRWLPHGVIVLLAPLKYGLALNTGSLLLSLLVLIVAYLLTVYLYRVVIESALSGPHWPLWAATGAAMIAGGVTCPPEQLVSMLANTLMLSGSAIVVAWRLKQGDSSVRLFAWGAFIVLAGGTAMFAAQWSQQMDLLVVLGQESAETFRRSLATMGYHPEAADAYAAQFAGIIESAARVVPATTLMNLVAQFTIGFLWFLGRGLPVERSATMLRPVAQWKVPFALTPLVVAAALGRLLGNDMVVLVADNVILALSLFYCVGGLALTTHVLNRFKAPLLIRILFYVMLTLTGVLGYLLTVLLGFIDSFADWRKLSARSIELDKDE